jgi:hypothetical protein
MTQTSSNLDVQSILPITIILSLAVAIIVTFVRKTIKHRQPLQVTTPISALEKIVSADNSLPLPFTKGVPSEIAASDHATVSRTRWVERLHDYFAYFRYKSNYNVLVINDQLEYLFSSDSVVEETVVEYIDIKRGPIPYRVIVLKEGNLINLGDGGYINWQFSGSHNRVGHSTVHFTTSGA